MGPGGRQLELSVAVQIIFFCGWEAWWRLTCSAAVSFWYGNGLSLVGNPDFFQKVFLVARHSRQWRLSLDRRKMALTISSHKCRDRRAMGSLKFARTKEVRKVWWSVVRDNHLSHATFDPEMVVGDLGEGRGRLGKGQ
jgi:hypothetical protein